MIASSPSLSSSPATLPASRAVRTTVGRPSPSECSPVRIAPRAESGARAAAAPAAAADAAATPSPDYLADLAVFQQVQGECGRLTVDECVQRFRLLYAGKQSYSDQALKLQFDTMRSGAHKASGAFIDLTSTKRTRPSPAMDDALDSDTSTRRSQPQTADRNEWQVKRPKVGREAEGAGRQEEDKYDSPISDSGDGDSDSDSDSDGGGQAKQQQGLVYEPLSPVAWSSTARSSLNGADAAAQQSNSSDDNSAAASTSLSGADICVSEAATSITPPADDALVERVAQALLQRKRHAMTAKHLRQIQLQQDRRRRWAEQCRACAKTIGQSVYRGATAVVCGYGLMQAVACVYPAQTEQAVAMAQYQVRALLANMPGGH
jgi:hypothetical protein